MTGTALAAGEQLRQFYKLGVSPIPPNKPNVREDEPDRVYVTAAAKNDGIVDHIIEVHATGQPILVGTQDVAESEDLHSRLLRRGCLRWCSTPRTTRRRPGSSPRPANSGGHSVDSDGRPGHRHQARRLGGRRRPEDKKSVAELGGLHVIGTGRHPTERLDNQLRGRTGRQGDPGSGVLPAGRTTSSPPTWTRPSCRPNAMRPDGSPAPRPPPCSTTPSGWPRASARRTRQHLAVQPADRPAAHDHRRAPQHPVEHRDRPRGTPGAFPGALRRADRGPWARTPRRTWSVSVATSCSITSTAAGPTTWPTCRTSGRASTCEALGRQNPLDEFHRLAVDAFAHLAADAIEASQQTFDTANVLEEEPVWTCPSWPADVDVDLYGPRQPDARRHHVGAEPARVFR